MHPGMVAHTYNPSIGEAVVKEYASSRLTYAILLVPGKPRLLNGSCLKTGICGNDV